MQYNRSLNFLDLLKHSSLFLFGARQTGKTSYLKENFPSARYIDLLNSRVFRELKTNPEILRETLSGKETLIIIDEIQKIPELLDEVHLLIERNKKLRFILTGSSARKLKRGSANLLAGRALTTHFHPLISKELDYKLLDRRINYGSLPAVLNSKIPSELLHSYVGNYLKEEIQAEGLSRNLENFSRFLDVAALSNGKILNFTSIGSDCGVAPRTIQNYYQILEDTLIGYQLPPFQKTKKRKPVSTSKFYFFDVGIVNALLERGKVSKKTEIYGDILEHIIFLELRAYLDYSRTRSSLSFWRTYSQHEVDFIIDDKIAIEVKSKEKVSDKDFSGLFEISNEIKLKRKILIANVPWRRKTDHGIEILPIEEFLKDLWAGKII